MGIYLGSQHIDNTNIINISSINTDIEDALVNRTIISYNNNEISNIRDYAFRGCNSLISINLPQATTIGNEAFYCCSSLASVNLPQATMVRDGAFAYCTSLISISLSQATTIGGYTFEGCSFLTSANLPQATTIGYSAFADCDSLTSVNLPQAASIDDYAFAYCISLTSISLPQATTIRYSAFTYCISLTSISLPQATTIGNGVFTYCYNLLSLCLLGSSIPTLANINAFMSTPISTYTTSTSGVYGSIYVPTSLYSSYITATNWSTYSARIVGVDTMTINYYMDGYSEDYLYEPSMTWADWVNSKYNTVGFVIQGNNVYMQDSETGDYVMLQETSFGDDPLSTENVSDYANLDLYMATFLSESSFAVTNNSGSIPSFIYETDMTWAEWINSNYNTANFVIDPETSYVGIWDDANNTYIYMVDPDHDASTIISTHKIVDDMRNKYNINFHIDTTLNGGN